MDLQELDTKTNAEAGKEVCLPHIDGTPSDAFITIRGTDSDAWIEAKSAYARKLSENSGPDGRVPPLVRADMEAELLASVTVGWRGLTKSGVPLDFSVGMAKQLYRNYPAVRDFINVSIADRKLFLLASSKESSSTGEASSN